MNDISNMNSELSTLGEVSYSAFNGDRTDSYIIMISNFIENDENIASFYSIIGKYMPDFSCNFFSSREEILKSELNKII